MKASDKSRCDEHGHVFLGLRHGTRCLCGEEEVTENDLVEIFSEPVCLGLLAAGGCPMNGDN